MSNEIQNKGKKSIKSKAGSLRVSIKLIISSQTDQEKKEETLFSNIRMR